MPDPFISEQDLSGLLGRDVTSDPAATMVVDAACDICRNAASNDFNLGTATYLLDGTGTDVILLPERPIVDAGTVLINGGTVTDYTVTAQGLLLRGSAGCNPRPLWPRGRQNITVTVESGYADGDVPRDVRMIALQIASRLIVQGVAKSEVVGDVQIEYGTNATDLTPGEERVLYNYRVKRSY